MGGSQLTANSKPMARQKRTDNRHSSEALVAAKVPQELDAVDVRHHDILRTAQLAHVWSEPHVATSHMFSQIKGETTIQGSCESVELDLD